MMYRTHMVASVVASTAVIPTLDKLNLIDNSNVLSVGLVFAGGILGAFLPDIDSPNSKIRRFIRKKLTGNPTPKKNIINHRREPHMPLIWAILFSSILFFVKEPILLTFIYGLIVGVYSHLFIDMFNPAGIPLCGPISKRRVSIMFIKASSVGEYIFLFLLLGLETYMLFVLKMPILNIIS